MDGGAWWAAVHGVTKSQTRLSNFTFTFLFHALEKEMAAHSSVLAWRIPGTVEPGGLPSLGSHRAGHDWSGSAAAAGSRTAPLHEFFLGLGWSGSNYLGHNLPVNEERNAGRNKQSYSVLPGPTGNWCSHFFHIRWPKRDACPTETNPWWGTFTLPGKPEQREDLEEKGGRENLLRNHRSQGTRFRIWS